MSSRTQGPQPATEMQDPAHAARSNAGPQRELRLVPGGYDIDSWPTHVPIQQGEHLQSWLARLAFRAGVSPRDLLQAADPAWHAVRDRGPSRWPLTRLAAQTRVDFASLASAHLSRLQVAYDDYATRYRRPAIRVTWESRFCPECLAESDAWPASWTHPLHVICVEHRAALVAFCGRCRQPPRAGNAWMSRTTAGSVCANRMRLPNDDGPRKTAPFCDADYREALTRTVTRSEQAAQAWLLECTELAACEAPPRARTIAGWECSASEVLDATFEIVNEYFAARSVCKSSNARRSDALSVARRILASPSVADAVRLADKHNVLSPTGTVTPVVMSSRLRSRPHSPVLVSLRLTSLGDRLSVADQLMYRTGSGRPAYPTTPTDRRAAPCASSASSGPPWVPQLLWPGILCEAGDVRARAALSIALAKVGSLMPLRAIAVDLELPASLADHVHTWWRRLGDDRHRVVRSLDRLYGSLVEAPPPIDYRHRRRVAWDREPFLAASSTALSLVPTPGTVEELGWHLWSAYSGSTRSARWDPLRPKTAIKGGLHDDHLKAAWDALASYLGCSQEPLAWRPP